MWIGEYSPGEDFGPGSAAIPWLELWRFLAPVPGDEQLVAFCWPVAVAVIASVDQYSLG